MLYVFNLDGIVLSNTHSLKLNREFIEEHCGVEKLLSVSELNPQIKEIIQSLLLNQHKVLIWSTISSDVEVYVNSLLERNNISNVILRFADRGSESTPTKIGWVKELIEDGSKPDLIFDNYLESTNELGFTPIVKFQTLHDHLTLKHKGSENTCDVETN